MSRAPIPPVPFSAFNAAQWEPLRRMATQVSELSDLGGVDGLTAQRGPNGTSIVDLSSSFTEFAFYGVLVNSGPNGYPDFTDARYWVRSITMGQSQNAKFTDSASAYIEPSYQTESGTYEGCMWVPAVNLGEVISQTHTLTPISSASLSPTSALPATGTIVRVYQIDAAKFTQAPYDYGNRIFVFEALNPPSSLSTLGRITSVSATLSNTAWLYNITLINVSTIQGYNALETLATSNSMIQGSPGSLGVTVATTGTLTGTSCAVKPIGATGWIPIYRDTVNAQWLFALTNSAG